MAVLKTEKLLLSMLLPFLLNIVTRVRGQAFGFLPFCADDAGNFTVNSTYYSNLNAAVASISSATDINYGFYNFSVGQTPDKPDDCRTCLINDCWQDSRPNCPSQKGAVIYTQDCMLRYSNYSIPGAIVDGPGQLLMSNDENVTNVDQFNQALSELLLERLRRQAAAGNSTWKFAVGSATTSDLTTIFGLMQCVPDLSKQVCSNCLVIAFQQIQQHNGKTGVTVKRPSCNLRYDLRPFYDQSFEVELVPPVSAPILPPPSRPPTQRKHSNTARVLFIAALPAAAVFLMGIGIFIGWKLRERKSSVENLDESRTIESLQYDFATIRDATSNFSDENKLGQGGFGAVYKGTLLNGQDIAVKRLSRQSGQGELEFKNEVLLVAKLQHRNLVRLLGFCTSGSERLLIYEFVPNTSLDHFIFDPTKRAELDWEKRYKIIKDIARGLVYLHEDSQLRIIHRDLKASNVLLDAAMTPKISDFGMARLFRVDQTQDETSRVVGTFGYMAPEYRLFGHFSIKTDVYSFGVLLLEIISGRRNNYTRHDEATDLLSFAWRNWREGTTSNLIDPTLTEDSKVEMLRCIDIGLLCIQENARDRPSMAAVITMLNSYSTILPTPCQPAVYMWSSNIESDTSPSTRYNNSGQTNFAEAKSKYSIDEASTISELYPR